MREKAQDTLHKTMVNKTNYKDVTLCEKELYIDRI